jgi:hypothetical protein
LWVSGFAEITEDEMQWNYGKCRHCLAVLQFRCNLVSKEGVPLEGVGAINPNLAHHLRSHAVAAAYADDEDVQDGDVVIENVPNVSFRSTCYLLISIIALMVGIFIAAYATSSHCSISPCQNGSCIDEVSNYFCLCTPGFTGRNCSVDIHEYLNIQSFGNRV